MNSNDIADSLAAAHGTGKEDTRKLVAGVFAAITGAAATGEEVSIPGFGKFKVKDSPARDGRNPATGAAMKIAASRKLTFTVAKAVKDKLNG
jgi:DNA-binding protein HU-beta